MGQNSLKSFVSSAAKLQPADQQSLIEAVRAACKRLAGAGWGALLKQHGLDILADNLANELAKPLSKIDRSLPGFEDFALEGCRGIEPGRPAHSLLFHAFASPQVVTRRSPKGDLVISAFPTQAEIESLENYVYGASPPSIDDLRARAGGAHLAIVVFTSEYRPAIATTHRKHADICYSRTGVARVGTEEAEYLPAARGYLPFVNGNGKKIRVLPCRYSAYVAALAPGKKDGHGPMRFIEPGAKAAAASSQQATDAGEVDVPLALQAHEVGDAHRNFWIPLHKLFDGNECIRGRTIEVRLRVSQVNEKIRRAHLKFLAAGHNAGWSEPDISQPPFIFHSGIAEFSSKMEDGSWLVMPMPHHHLVEPAEYKGKPLTYLVPKTTADDGPNWRVYSSSLNLLPQHNGARAAPEYVHARHEILPDGQERDLNKETNLVDIVKQGGYRARHYVDFTGDGWVDVECSELALDIPRRLPAYSIVASPHFFPFVDQTDLMRWTDQSVLPSLIKSLWDAPGAGLPQALSDQRYAANLQLAGASFDAADDTMTAIVGQFGSGGGKLTRIDRPKNERASMLTDSAAGVFAPGWDVSYDRTTESDVADTGTTLVPGVTFLTNYGLGSPFVEDSKLCAALSSFWPAAAPDITRTFAPSRVYATATPLTDEVIGVGSAEPWDGIRGPVVKPEDKVVQYPLLAYGDYVRTALDNQFNIAIIGQTSVEEYVARSLTMAMVYRALGILTQKDKLKWSVLSFHPADPNDADLEQAHKSTGRHTSPAFTYRFTMFQHNDLGQPDPKAFDKVLVAYKEIILLFADPSFVLRRESDGTWTPYELRR